MELMKLLFFLWAIIAFGLWLFSNDPVTMFNAVGVILSGSAATLFWIFRRPISNVCNTIKISPKIKFVLVGGVAGFLTELIYWLVQKFSGVAGVQASPHFFQNLLGTMPLYVTIIALLLVVETRYNYSLFAILIYGGIYDFFADGALGTLLTTGGLPIDAIALMTVSFPVFVVSYSFMVLPASYLLKNDPATKQPTETGRKKYICGLLPVTGIFIFGIIAFSLFL